MLKLQLQLPSVPKYFIKKISRQWTCIVLHAQVLMICMALVQQHDSSLQYEQQSRAEFAVHLPGRITALRSLYAVNLQYSC